jgi:hypothetical protein
MAHFAHLRTLDVRHQALILEQESYWASLNAWNSKGRDLEYEQQLWKRLDAFTKPPIANTYSFGDVSLTVPVLLRLLIASNPSHPLQIRSTPTRKRVFDSIVEVSTQIGGHVAKYANIQGRRIIQRLFEPEAQPTLAQIVRSILTRSIRSQFRPRRTTQSSRARFSPSKHQYSPRQQAQMVEGVPSSLNLALPQFTSQHLEVGGASLVPEGNRHVEVKQPGATQRSDGEGTYTDDMMDLDGDSYEIEYQRSTRPQHNPSKDDDIWRFPVCPPEIAQADDGYLTGICTNCRKTGHLQYECPHPLSNGDEHRKSHLLKSAPPKMKAGRPRKASLGVEQRISHGEPPPAQGGIMTRNRSEQIERMALQQQLDRELAQATSKDSQSRCCTSDALLEKY